MEEEEKQTSTNECVTRKVGSAIKDQRRRERGEGAELLPEDRAGGCLPKRPSSLPDGDRKVPGIR